MIRFYSRCCAMIFALTTLCLSAYSQTITGTVYDENGESLPGVTVRIDGTTKGDATDLEGKYTIQNAPVGQQNLIISFIGYKQAKVEVNVPASGTVTVDKNMELDSESLAEYVVVGYGVQRQREVTGSIGKVTSKQITDIPTPSFEAALQGKAAGVQVTQGSGLAGSASVVRIRGIASISAAGDPLYVLDGIPITQDYFQNGNRGAFNNNPLATINPNDIESIEILKDAAATGIYGSRGANGVILITTKVGSKKGWNYNFGSRLGVSLPTALPDMLNSNEWLTLYQEAYENDGGVGLAPLPSGISWEDARQTDTDWIDETTQVGFKQSYNFSAQMGGEKFDFYGSLGYEDNGSYLAGNSYERLSLRSNFTYRFTDKLNIAFTTSLSRGINNRIDAAWSGGLGAAMSTALPIYPIFFKDTVFDPEGRIINLPGDYWDDGANPVRTRELQEWRTTEWRSINTAALTFIPTKNLILKGSVGYDYSDLKDDIYFPRSLREGNRLQQELFPNNNNPLAERRPSWTNNWNTSVTGTYLYDLNAENKFTFLIGMEYQQSTTTAKNRLFRSDSLVDGPFYDNPDYLNIQYQAQVEDSTGEVIDALRLGYQSDGDRRKENFNFISAFARINYSLKDKYFAQASIRTDGSSRFGEDNRFGFFPSVSAGWILSEEAFLKDNKVISFLKLRTGFGITGNAAIPNYQQYGSYAVRENGYGGETFRFLEVPPNPDLKWETSNVFDLSIEAGFFEDRITTTLSFYNKQTNDVLLNAIPPPSTGFPSIWDNAGSIVNRGIELQVSSTNIDRKNFSWRTDFNIAYNYNEIKDLGGYTNDAVGGGTNDTRVAIGEPVGANFLNRYSHVDPETGRPVYLDLDGNETFDLDLNDRQVVGRVLPFAVGGITNTFTIGNWGIGLVMVYSLGSDIYDGSLKYQYHPNGQGTPWNSDHGALDRWRQPGDQTYLPVASRDIGTYGLPSVDNWNTTQWLDDGDYLRLRRLSVGYNFNKFKVGSMNFQGANITVSATNFLTFTNYDGLDPEIARDFENAQDRNLSPNINYLTPPQEMSFNVAFNLRF